MLCLLRLNKLHLHALLPFLLLPKILILFFLAFLHLASVVVSPGWVALIQMGYIPLSRRSWDSPALLLPLPALLSLWHADPLPSPIDPARPEPCSLPSTNSSHLFLPLLHICGYLEINMVGQSRGKLFSKEDMIMFQKVKIFRRLSA